MKQTNKLTIRQKAEQKRKKDTLLSLPTRITPDMVSMDSEPMKAFPLFTNEEALKKFFA